MSHSLLGLPVPVVESVGMVVVYPTVGLNQESDQGHRIQRTSIALQHILVVLLQQSQEAQRSTHSKLGCDRVCGTIHNQAPNIRIHSKWIRMCLRMLDQSQFPDRAVWQYREVHHADLAR